MGESSKFDAELISTSITLPNGRVVPNRLVKAAMEEGIGYGGGPPDIRHRRLYKRWAQGGWGMIITGNVQTDPRHLATAHDRTFPPTPKARSAWRHLVDTVQSLSKSSDRPLLLMQISHAGLQSSSTINLSRPPWVRAVSSCSSRPDMGSSMIGAVIGGVIFPLKSRVLQPEEWVGIIEGFVRVAKDAEGAGFDGVQLHSAHGYLLAEYLSPLIANGKTNPEPYPLPDVPKTVSPRLHLLWLILNEIAQSTDQSFIKSIKINSSDFVQGGLDETQSSELIKEIVSWNILDILEISGGNYSNPTFAELSSITTSTRQSMFIHFCRSLVPNLPVDGPAILLTGGLHSRDLIADALRPRATNRAACDLVGIGRPACIRPDLPNSVILNPDVPDIDARIGGYTIPGGEFWKRVLGGGSSAQPPAKKDPRADNSGPEVATYVPEADEREPLIPKNAAAVRQQVGIPLVGAGISTYWHEWQLCRIGRGVEPDLGLGWMLGGLVGEGVWWSLLGACGLVGR